MKNNGASFNIESRKSSLSLDSILDIVDRTFKHWSLAPTLILFILLSVVPAFNLLRMSVSDIKFARGEVIWNFVGLKNVITLLEDKLLGITIWNTLVFVAAVVVIEVFLGFFLAMLTSRIGGQPGFYRTIMVLPILVPAITIGSMWRLLYDTDFGLINKIIVFLGFETISFLGSVKNAMMSVVFVDVWHWIPFVFLICLAGFEALPVETLEAASVDGANERQMLRHIIIPLMWPTLSVVIMFRTIFAFKVFDEIFLLTSGGPGTSTEVISLYIYKVYFEQDRLGYGALISLFTIAIIIVVLLLFRRIQPKER